jgi:hypothetical protein
VELDSEEKVMNFDFHHVTEGDGKIVLCFETNEYADPVRINFNYDSGFIYVHKHIQLIGSETHDFE